MMSFGANYINYKAGFPDQTVLPNPHSPLPLAIQK